jgi:hypothetical protein
LVVHKEHWNVLEPVAPDPILLDYEAKTNEEKQPA